MSVDDAIRRLGEAAWVSVMYQMLSADGEYGVSLVVERTREEVMDAIREHGVEESGTEATKMGFPLVIVRYPMQDDEGHWWRTPLFIGAGRHA